MTISNFSVVSDSMDYFTMERLVHFESELTEEDTKEEIKKYVSKVDACPIKDLEILDFAWGESFRGLYNPNRCVVKVNKEGQ